MRHTSCQCTRIEPKNEFDPTPTQNTVPLTPCKDQAAERTRVAQIYRNTVLLECNKIPKIKAMKLRWAQVYSDPTQSFGTQQILISEIF